LPGETWSTGVSTSMKSWAANQPRKAAVICARAFNKGRRSACRIWSQSGDIGFVKASLEGKLGTGNRAQDQYGAARNHHIPAV
jgi:hypothetical protein